MSAQKKHKIIHHKDCPSPKHPCFCDCHTRETECLDCLCGRHKEKQGVLSQKEPEEDTIDKKIIELASKYNGYHKSWLVNWIKDLLSSQRTQTIEEIKKIIPKEMKCKHKKPLDLINGECFAYSGWNACCKVILTKIDSLK